VLRIKNESIDYLPPMGKTLTPDEFKSIMNYIFENHSFGQCHSRFIKYIRPSFDTRDRRCFHIKFDDKDIDFRDNGKPMYDNIMNWLKEGEK